MTTLTPHRPRRIDGLDAARGIAVLGMFIAHTAPLLGVDPELTRPDTWLDLVNGRSSLLFALCAGVSLTLATRTRSGAADDPVARRRTVLARAVALFVLGAVLESLATPVAVILQTYAVCFVLSLPLLRARARTVLVVALSSLLVGPPLVLLGQAFARGGQDAIVSGVLLGAYPALTWWGVVLTGVLLGRADLSSVRTAWTMLAGGAVAALSGYGGGALVRLALDLPLGRAPLPDLGAGDGRPAGTEVHSGGAPVAIVPQGGGTLEHPEIDWASLTSIAPHAGSTFEVVGGVGVAAAVLAVSVLVVPRLRALAFPIVSVGRLALTLYAAHIVVLAAVGSGRGSSTTAGAPDTAAWVLAGALVTGSLVVAPLWCRFVGQGPLERLVGRIGRSLGPRPDARATSTSTSTSTG